MLSHFRIHRRGPSNPSSPVPDQLSPLDHTEHAHSAHDVSSRPDVLTRPANAASTPPVHPAGPRTDPDPTPNRKPSEQSLKESSSPSVKSPQSTGDSGFMGGLALENYRRAFTAKREDSSAVVRQAPAAQQPPRSKPLPPPINTNLSSAHPPPVPVKELRSRSSFVAPTELQNNGGATGKRPSAARLTSEPAALASTQSVTESQKGKKGLPFLKNSMSGLLMRRKASQNAPDLRPLPLPQKPAEAPYDPRIRGTRVHDFSAPRQRVVPTRKPTVPGAEVWSGLQGASSSLVPEHVSRSPTGRSSSAVSEKTQPGVSDTESQRPHELSKEPSKKSTTELKRVSLDDKPLPAEPASSGQTVETKRSASQSSVPSATANTESISKANPSTRTNRSRHISLSDGSIKDGVALALPKHMKSTSSRFSFDMMGAARAEKALEERHRQKELERKANNPNNRDSRFDDFDEDSFDYDAAMAEDGFEEDIPMIGDDDFLDDDAFFEEDVPVIGDDVVDTEDDPDNDQENFAGFVFQRSNPQSSLASPAVGTLLATPRDATGKAIGYAMTKDTTPELQSATSPLANTETPVTQENSPHADGPGVQAPEAPRKTQYDPTVFQERRHQPIDDEDLEGTADKELYFDEGLLEELRMEADEIQGSTFDESIFDINDTDQYGRPIPGAFAQAQATRAVQGQEVKKRESDIVSASGLSGSTAHTSVSLGLQPMPSMTEKGRELSSQKEAAAVTSPSQIPTEGKVAAYQAALAEAAHKAAASGWKFKWEDQPASPPSPSPSPPLQPPPPPADPVDPDVTITSPTTGSQPSSGGQIINNAAQDDYDEYADYDDGFGGGFDDNFDDEFDFDDDFIAEANAEALAYDSDGFYGQEFGFYSAPIPQGHGASKVGGSSLTTDNVYGGYFGPSGIGRTTSGRVVSREPNLTPITERSEYSNRNSIMSLGLPLGTSEGRNSLQSPGLAQLAMMTDDGKMSLAELLRLRSKAWGGSQVSLNSSREGSPRSERAPPGDRFEGTSSPAPWETGRPKSQVGLSGGTHARKNSAFSLWSNSDAASGAGSPTLTMGLSMANSAPPPPLFSPPPPPIPQPSPGFQCPPVIEDEEEASSSGLSTKSPTVDHAGDSKDTYDANAKIDTVTSAVDAASSPPQDALESSPPPPPNTNVSSPSKRLGHRHKSSAESISYSMDEDRESGETRWVMERRRTAESGEIEVLRREVVSARSI